MTFRDRTDAGQQLAAALKDRGYATPVVLGIPRGGVPVAEQVVRLLGGELSVAVARKLGAPDYPELAIGATTADGATYINEAVATAAGADERYIEAEKARQVQEARRREALFDGHRRPVLRGRVVIVVDDGIATGATAIAAIRSLKAAGAARVVLAVPVGPPETLDLLRGEADEVVCLEEDPGFGAVGQYYIDFDQVSDNEVIRILDAFRDTSVGAIHRRVSIGHDGVTLSADLTTPGRGGPFPLVIFVHGLGSSKESPRNVAIAERLVDAGIATLLFDLSGHGESSAAEGGVEAYVADLAAVFEWARKEPAFVPGAIGIAGSSLGAVVTAMALGGGNVRPRTAVLRAPPMEPSEFRMVNVPSLVIVGSLDPLREQAEQGVARHPHLRLAVIEGAGHLFDEPGALEQALAQTVDWFTARLLEPPPARARA